MQYKPNGRRLPFLKYRVRKCTVIDGGDGRAHGRDDGRAADAVAVGPGEVAVLDKPGGEDRRRGQQEAEAGGVGVVQATGQPGGHHHAVAADPGDERARLSGADDPRLAVLQGVQRPIALGVQSLAAGQLAHLGAAAVALGVEQDAAVDDEEDRRRQRLGQRLADDALEQQAEDPDRDGGADDQPGQALGGRLDAPLAQRGEEGLISASQSRQK